MSTHSHRWSSIVAFAISCAGNADPDASPGRDTGDGGSPVGTSGSAGTTQDDSTGPPTTTQIGPLLDLGGGLFDVGRGASLCACSEDGAAILGCDGAVINECSASERCHPARLECVARCSYASEIRGSEGCEFFATYMDNARSALDSSFNGCFAVALANDSPAHVELDVRHAGSDLDASAFTAVLGPEDGTLQPYDPATGLGPGRVALLFLSGPEGGPEDAAGCPMPSAVPTGVVMPHASGIGSSFEIVTTAPVSAYQFNPYGGGPAAITGASLLLPSTAWGTEYLAVNAHGPSQPPDIPSMTSMNIVASEDETTVTFVGSSAVVGGGGIPATPAGQELSVVLNRGEHLQLSQPTELTGSSLSTDKPVGFMAGHSCMFVPATVDFCDHGEQMIPPVSALGHEYVGIMHRPRGNEPGVFRVIGVVDDTILSWSSDVGGVETLGAGQVSEFFTADPFTVESQDPEHPFIFLSYMSGNQWGPLGSAAIADRRGDADVVVGVPSSQFRRNYTFMTDPTYPEASLVVVRKATDGVFHDVNLECFGAIVDWSEIGEYEWTRFELRSEGVSAPGCSPGHQHMFSSGEFGVTVWGWGSSAHGSGNVSYGFPAGMQIDDVNSVELRPAG